MGQKTELASVAELENKITEHLGKQGYQITKNAKLLGKSGIEHTFNLVARQQDGFANYVIAINVSTDADREAQLLTIFDFANKTYDAGVRERILIPVSGLDPEARELAQRQRLWVIDAHEVEKLLTIKGKERKHLTGAAKPFGFETESQLLETLTDLGYRVEKKVRVHGRSGAEYTFDILAYGDHGLMAHSLGIDTFEQYEVVRLEQVSLFDTKAYDTGIDHKAIYVTSKLTPEARQFAEHQQIKVLEPQKPEATGAKESPEVAAGIPGKPAEKVPPKPLRQMPQPEALQLIPEVMARRYNAIPLTITGNTLAVAMANPTDIFALEAFAAQTRKRIKPVAATAEEVRGAIDFNYKAYGEIEEQLSRISISNEVTDEKMALVAAADAPLTQALNLIIEEAAKARSSDIHIDPEENRLRVRYRIDGTLHDTMSLPLNIHRPLISRIKILAEMNIADHYRPQDGQFSTAAKGRQLDIRVATAPTVHGEMAVLRLLDKSMASRGLSEIGMLPDTLAKYERMLKYPYGMILVSGPTGSGKTTTLYASINTLDTLSKNVITIEDPAEYRFKDINQIQVNTQAGITFASGLRSILRLDPNVILVGEVRDTETANIATQAALTGHLMLSSIHANDSVGVFFRLLDLGVEQFLIASSVIGIIAQRMVRRICRDCTRLIEAPVVEQLAYEKVMGEKRTQFSYGTGCPSCSFTGYLGRTGLFEMLTVSDNIRTLLSKGAGKVEIHEQALTEGMVPMIKDGMLKVKAGVTTPSEVLHATYTQE